MLAVSRRNEIIDIVTEKKNVTVINLAKIFNVTDETIRRDLKLLEQQRLLVKTHGGAFIQDGTTNDINISIRTGAYVMNKKIIAQECINLINNGDSIFLDCSTTAYHIAEVIKNKRLTVITNSLEISNLLSQCDGIALTVIGGTLNRTHMCYVGKTAVQSLKNYFVDKAFLSCRSLSIAHGVTDSNENIAEIRSQLFDQANNIYIIADYTKFNKTSFISIGSFENITGIITDKPLNSQWLECLNTYNVEYYFPRVIQSH